MANVSSAIDLYCGMSKWQKKKQKKKKKEKKKQKKKKNYRAMSGVYGGESKYHPSS